MRVAPTNEQYTVSAFCEAITNDLQNKVTWCAVQAATSGPRINGKQLDDNVQAAIHAAEWLDRAVERYRS